MYMHAHAGTKEEMEELLQERNSSEKQEDEQSSEKEHSPSSHKEDRERYKRNKGRESRIKVCFTCVQDCTV